MSFWFLCAAAALSCAWLILHLTLGERDVAQPFLNANDMDPTVRETQYLCWHFTSVSIACMAVFFGAAAYWNEMMLAIAGAILASGFAVSGIGLVTMRGAGHGRVPQGWLFVPVAALGLLGVLT